MKQAQEAVNGIDDLIFNVPRGLHLALQFKAARPHPRDGQPYFLFGTSALQHSNLMRLARGRQRGVLYVLPQVNTFKSLNAISTNLLWSTYWLPVSNLAFLSPSSHRIWTNPAETVVESEVTRVDRLDTETMLLGLRQDFQISRDRLVQSARGLDIENLMEQGELREWLFELSQETRSDLRSLGQRLRGFSTICMVPE
jgi:hypothetical protein